MNGCPLFLVVLVAVASGAAALKCYECTLCNDPFDTSSGKVVDNCKSCIKGKSGEQVVRVCSNEDSGDACETQDDRERCSCNSDLCNSAYRSDLSYIALIVCTLSAIPIWKI